jgi:hypothetical protein
VVQWEISYVMLPLYAADGSVRAYTRIDAGDFAWADQWRWRVQAGRNGVYYAARSQGRTRPGRRGGPITVFLHRDLLGLPRENDGREVDHINGDPLDNRRSNLRVVPHALVNQNTASRAGASSQYRGVYRRKNRSGRWVWRAEVQLAGVRHLLGTFMSEIEAARIAQEWRAANMPGAVEERHPVPALSSGEGA